MTFLTKGGLIEKVAPKQYRATGVDTTATNCGGRLTDS
jgi:hypothetical protein